MGDWTESKYHETRFGGMDKSVEPHTLDRDGGIMADEFNMMSRTQGLRTRKGWKMAHDLSLYVSSLPGTPKSPLGIIPYVPNITTVAEDDDDDDDGGNGGVIGGLIDDGGGGGGGSTIPVTLSLAAPQAVVADVPFNISSAASNPYNGGNAHLEWAFQPGGQPSVSLTKGIRSGWDNQAWSAQATIWTADRTRTGVTATLKIGNTTKATKNMGYSVADMIPSLTSPVPYRQQFTFTVACKLGGATLSGYAGEGRGVSISWQAFDADDKTVSCHVSCSQTGWADGVGTYSARLTSVSATAVKLKVTATYAGESHTAEASIQGVGYLRVPSSLHVYGGGGSMRINAVGLTPSALSIVAQVGGQTVDIDGFLELDNGSPVNFSSGWEGNVWENTVRAKSSASSGTLTLKLMNGETEQATADITISNGIEATLDVPESVLPGGNIEASATISATGFTLTRLPEGTVHLQIGPNAEVNEPNEENELEITGVMEDVASGSYVVQVVDMRDGTPLAQATVTVQTIYEALAEAINERSLAMHGEPVSIYGGGGHGEDGWYDGSETASTLAQAAIAAMTGYVKEIDLNQGTVTNFSSSNTGISASQPAGKTEQQWMADVYATIKTAKAVSTTSFSKEGSGRDGYASNQRSSNYDEATDTTSWSETTDALFARTKTKMETDSQDIAYTSYGEAKQTSSYSGGNAGEYMAGLAYCSMTFNKLRVKCTSSVGYANFTRTVRWLGHSAKLGSNFSKLGHDIPNEGEYGYVLGQQTASAGNDFDWSGWHASSFSPSFTWNSQSEGYYLYIDKGIMEFNFSHK